MLLVIEALAALVVFSTTPSAVTATTTPISPISAPTAEIEVKVLSVQEYIQSEAIKRNLDVGRVLKIARCESGFVPQQSRVIKKDGTRENSWGVFQIHLDAHKTVTREQAMSIEWSTRWALDHMEKGHWKMWSCDKM